MQKRGQISVVILLAVFVTLVLAVTLFIRSTIYENASEASTLRTLRSSLDIQPVNSYVSSCLQQVTRQALLKVGAQGGYLDPAGSPDYGEGGATNYTSYNSTLIPYYVIDGENRILPIGNITERLRRYLAVEVQDCLDFTIFEERNYNISGPVINYSAIGFNFSRTVTNYSTSRVNVTVVLSTRDTTFFLQYPILVSHRTSRNELLHFQYAEPVPFSRIHENVTFLAQEILNNDPYDLSANCNSYMANQIDVLNSTIIRFTVNITDDEKYAYQFAVNATVTGSCSQ
jgi:hypothetical protein